MSYLEKLLDGAEVAWLPVSELFDLKNGYTPSRSNKEFWNSGTIPWFRMDDIRANGRILKDSLLKITPEAVKGGRLFPANSILIATTATIGEHALIAVPHLSNQQFTSLSLKPDFSARLDMRFVYYYCFVLANWCLKNTNQSSFSSVNMAGFKRFKFPLPPLPVQEEIVRILDAFTSLTAELTAELTARKQQYNYYRNQLLTFNEDEVDHLPMGQEGVGEFIRGGSLQKKDFTESGVGCIHYGQIYTHYGTFADKTKSFVSEAAFDKAKKAKKGDLIITDTSENDEDLCKAVAWLGDEEIAISNHTFIYTHSLNPKYVSYFLQTEMFHKQKRPFITGAKVRSISAGNMAKILIPVPSPEEQARIVSILDKFDALTNSISEGLPREIALREKQYAYYRDQLLSFPKLDEVAA